MRCANGHDGQPGMRFCGHCGLPLPGDEDESPAADAAHEHLLAANVSQFITASELGMPAADAKPESATVTDGGLSGSAKRSIAVGVALLAVIAAVGLLTQGGTSGSTEIEKAAEACGVEGSVRDEGSSITFDTKGHDDLAGDSYADVICVLAYLDTPDRIISQMDQTRALDGTQDASWDDYEAFWNYHPDDGMNLTVFRP